MINMATGIHENKNSEITTVIRSPDGPVRLRNLNAAINVRVSSRGNTGWIYVTIESYVSSNAVEGPCLRLRCPMRIVARQLQLIEILGDK